MEDLTRNALMPARRISKLLGGDAWMSQRIGQLGTIQTKNDSSLRKLEDAFNASLVSQSVVEDTGLFNSALIEALVRAFHERQIASSLKKGTRNDFNLVVIDYQRAAELVQEEQSGQDQ